MKKEQIINRVADEAGRIDLKANKNKPDIAATEQNRIKVNRRRSIEDFQDEKRVRQESGYE